jgi:hypothetical protein
MRGGRSAPAARRAALRAATIALGATLALPALANRAPPAPGRLAAQDVPPLRIAPALLGASELTPGVRVAVDLNRRFIQLDGTPRRARIGLDLDFPLALRAERNPETLRAEAGVGLLLAGIRVATPVAGQPPPLDAPRRLGFLELVVEARAEAAQRLTDADLGLAAGLAYEHDRDDLWLVPAVELALALVDCVGCDLPAGEGSRSRRLELRSDWSIPLSPRAPALRLRPGARLFRAWGMGEELASLREGRGAWGQVELAWAVDGVAWLHEVHAGWRGGRLPVAVAEERAWSVGITIVP